MMLVIYPIISSGQDKVVKDLDGDATMDTVYVDVRRSRIICQLSSKKFHEIQSSEIEILNDQAGIRATKNGFEFFNDWMRAGYNNQFRYDSRTKKIQLIGMSRYEFGNAANDGSGQSSVNLLTGDYIGNWNYYDMDKEELIPIPTIKTKMVFSKIYLETFSDKSYFDYADKCAALYDTYKGVTIKKKKRNR